MDEYTLSAERASKELTKTFSTSFSSAASLFPKSIRQDIYNIYGLVRIADEVVDTYQSSGAAVMLDTLENEVYATLKTGFSTNIIVHAFCLTANKYNIGAPLIRPFFTSMRTDLTKKTFNPREYKQYIYGSAEVVGLMCLKVFVAGDRVRYKELSQGAAALGAAFQKVNFLRDIKDDFVTRGRYYFPNGSYDHFDDEQKALIIADISKDFSKAYPYIQQLPKNARTPTKLAYKYYRQLLTIISHCSAYELKQRRIRVPKYVKAILLAQSRVSKYGR